MESYKYVNGGIACAAILSDLGFLPYGYERCLNDAAASGSPLDEFSDNARIVKAALCAGVFSIFTSKQDPPLIQSVQLAIMSFVIDVHALTSLVPW